jgi:hypothetical protein
VALKLNQRFLAGIAFAFAVVWLDRSSTIWRLAARLLHRRQQVP